MSLKRPLGELLVALFWTALFTTPYLFLCQRAFPTGGLMYWLSLLVGFFVIGDTPTRARKTVADLWRNRPGRAVDAKGA